MVGLSGSGVVVELWWSCGDGVVMVVFTVGVFGCVGGTSSVWQGCIVVVVF